LVDVVADGTGDTRDGRLHFRHTPLGFLAPLETALAARCLRGDGAHGLQRRADICGDAPAVAPHAALQVDTVSGVAHGLEALGDLRALLGEALVLPASRCEGRLGVLKTQGGFWRPARPALFGLSAGALKPRWSLSKSLLRRGGRLVGGSLCGGKGGTHGGAACMLDRAHVRRVRRAERMCNRGQQSRGFITAGWHHLTVQLRQGGRHECMPDT
jgi:hypothetical protein